MKHLLPLMKQIELYLKSNTKFDIDIWSQLSDLTDWEYRIIQDFMIRVNLFIEQNNNNFVYKIYEKNIDTPIDIVDNPIDLLVVSLKREKTDTVLTDIFNRVPTPTGISVDYLEIWGQHVTSGRNFGVKEALRRNATYLLFVDDDIIAPQGSVLQLFETMNETDANVVAGQYYRKTTPLISAHGNHELIIQDEMIYQVDMCAMGYTLINIQNVAKYVPTPLFWDFGAPDGYWSMGEDAFFTKNVIEYMNSYPIVDNKIQLLHYDKSWKKWYGEKDNNTIYATNAITNLEQFESLRTPKNNPLITICTPRRSEQDLIAVNLSEMLLLRGYRTDTLYCVGMNVDDARNQLVSHALKNDSDYILFIDDDIIPPIDGLCRLLEIFESTEYKNIGCVSGDYCLKGTPSFSAHLQINEDGRVTELDRLNNNDNIIYNNWLVGLGFCLIDANFFRQSRPPWFKCHTRDSKDNLVNEDAHFSELMLQSGNNIIVNRNIKCLHVEYNKQEVYGFDNDFDKTKYAYYNWMLDYKYVPFTSTKDDI